MATSKHWLTQTPKELLDDFNSKQSEHFIVLKTNVYFFQGGHVLLLRQRDLAFGQAEEWAVPRDTERVDRPEPHPTQQVVTTVPIRTRVLTQLLQLRIPPQTLHETQFMEFSKSEPLYLPDGDTLQIWVILTAYDSSFSTNARAVFLTHLNNAVQYRWANEADLVTNVNTPASGDEDDRCSQLHILDLQNAFLRLTLCAKDSILIEDSSLPTAEASNSLPFICQQVFAAAIEARACTYQGDAAKHGIVLLSTKAQLPHLSVTYLRAEQMRNVGAWPGGIQKGNEVYRLIGAFSGGQVKWLSKPKTVPWGELMQESGRVRIVWGE